MSTRDTAAAAAEHAARASYGRLVALLAAPSGDLQLAEDCLSEAFERALRSWPERGVPDNPEGWLLTVARNQQRDAWRSAAHRLAAPFDALTETSGATWSLEQVDLDAIPDKRLELLFACAHPDLDPAVRTPLMLQAVLGFEAAQIAAAFAVPTATMAQRLVRAKRRLKQAGTGYAVPDRAAMPERLPPVLEAVYGCYAITRSSLPGTGDPELFMAGEAQHLAVTLATLLDDDPEAWGLAALLTLAMSRPGAIPDAAGYVPLDEQDPATWDPEAIAAGEAYLRRGSALGRLGRFQVEAAIQAVHVEGARTGTTDHAALRTLYSALNALAPTLGSQVALACAVARTDGADAGLAALDDLAAAHPVHRFQPYWAARGHLLSQAGRSAEAAGALEAAAALTAPGPVRAHLERRAALSAGT